MKQDIQSIRIMAYGLNYICLLKALLVIKLRARASFFLIYIMLTSKINKRIQHVFGVKCRSATAV